MPHTAICSILVGVPGWIPIPLHGAESVITTDFHDGFGPWQALHTGTWKQDSETGTVILDQPGAQRPPVRRPSAYLLLPGIVWSDLTLTLEARTLAPPETINRDIVLLFGYTDDTHYYYAHLSSRSDGEAHTVIMKVAGDVRETIQRESLPPPPLGNEWQTFRVRLYPDGEIKVFVDDFEHPLLSAHDTTYPAGAVGFGSFDDRAEFRLVTVSGEQHPAIAPTPFWNGQAWAIDTSAGFHTTTERSDDLRNWAPVPGPDADETKQSQKDECFLRFTLEGPELPSPDEEFP